MNSAGRYAPSPSGDLHFCNLRTALLAWLCARSTGRRFIVRVEDVDSQRSSAESAQRQLEDLATLGLDWDEVVVQSEREEAYAQAIAQLPVYECFCSRKDIQEASRAPHAIPGQYPGTCRSLSDAALEQRRSAFRAQGRTPALRLRAEVSQWAVHDLLHGEYLGEVDDFIVRRGAQPGGHADWAYNVAVVVDDAFSGVDQVVRGDDLLSSAPRQAYLAHLLGVPVPEYVHVPLVLNAEGKRLAKRDGAVTLRQMLETRTIAEVVQQMAATLGLKGASPAEVLSGFDMSAIPREPSIFNA